LKIELTPEQSKFREDARRFVDKEIVPFADESDANETLTDNVINKMKSSGYLGSMIPGEYGGMELDNVTLGILNEEVGRGCSSVRAILTVHGMVALGILKWGTDQQKKEYLGKMAKGEIIGAFALTEPNIGSDAKNVEATAVFSQGRYILNGKKKWITMGQIADIFLVFAQCEGKPTAFLVRKDTPGLSIKKTTGLLGMRASMIGELDMENCSVSKDCLVGSVGTGFSHVALTCLNFGRYTIACGCVGLAQACLEASSKYAKMRKQFGIPLSENQLIQKMITEMVVNIKAARLLCFHAGYLSDIGDPNSIIETWIAKYFSSTMLAKIVNDAVQIHGANGCIRGYGVERFLRDAKINEIIEGTTQIHEILIATNTLRSI